MSPSFRDIVSDRFHELVSQTSVGVQFWNLVESEGLLDPSSVVKENGDTYIVCKEFYNLLLRCQWNSRKEKSLLKVLDNTGNKKALQIFLSEINQDGLSDGRRSQETTFSSNDYQIEAYDMEVDFVNDTRGLALVINNEFNNCGDVGREGSKQDESSLSRVLKELKFEVILKPNLTRDQFKTTIEEFAKDPRHSAAKCFMIVIMSHGEKDIIYANDNNPIYIEWILSQFNNANCPLLTGKPKMFFFQSCRGEKKDLVTVDAQPFPDESPKGLAFYVNPTWEDMIVAYSTMDGFVAYRGLTGSWFIQELCLILGKYSPMGISLRDMLDFLSRSLKKKELSAGGNQVYKQTCCYMVIHLYKRIYFNK